MNTFSIANFFTMQSKVEHVEVAVTANTGTSEAKELRIPPSQENSTLNLSPLYVSKLVSYNMSHTRI